MRCVINENGERQKERKRTLVNLKENGVDVAGEHHGIASLAQKRKRESIVQTDPENI